MHVQLEPTCTLTYPRCAVFAVVAVAVAPQEEGVVAAVGAVVELRLDDADGLPREVVRHVPHEGEDQH